ncbi:MAG: preprotein translocase subunit SecG [bacterium]|nr:preprotein translocase subunit SecG [bacterium]
MSILIGFLYVVEVVVCLLLALVVMLQKPKEGGLGGLAGGMGEAVFGANAGNVLIKVTAWLGAIFLINTLVLARFTSKSDPHAGSVMAGEQAPVQKEAVPQPLSLDPEALKQTPAPAAAPAAQPPAPAAKPAAPAAPAKPAAVPAKPAAPAAAPAKPASPAPAAKPATPTPEAQRRQVPETPAAPAPVPAKPAPAAK